MQVVPGTRVHVSSASRIPIGWGTFICMWPVKELDNTQVPAILLDVGKIILGPQCWWTSEIGKDAPPIPIKEISLAHPVMTFIALPVPKKALARGVWTRRFDLRIADWRSLRLENDNSGAEMLFGGFDFKSETTRLYVLATDMGFPMYESE